MRRNVPHGKNDHRGAAAQELEAAWPLPPPSPIVDRIAGGEGLEGVRRQAWARWDHHPNDPASLPAR